MYMYYFKVNVIFEEDNWKSHSEEGYVVGDSLSDALKNITKFYGEDDIVDVKLAYITDRPLILLPSLENIDKKKLLKAINDHNAI